MPAKAKAKKVSKYAAKTGGGSKLNPAPKKVLNKSKGKRGR